jgi:hypothetical protein
VAGQNYARVPTQILDTLVREKVGNIYIRVIAFFGATSLVLLAYIALGYRPGISNLMLVTFLGLASLFSFVELGRRAFYFFDATIMVRFVAGEIMQAIRACTSSGRLWLSPAFQGHYRKQASSDIHIYEDVILLAHKEGQLQGRSLEELSVQLLSLLVTTALWREKKWHTD